MKRSIAPHPATAFPVSGRMDAGVHEARSAFVSEPMASAMGDTGVIDVDRVADIFHMSKAQLAETAGLGTASMSKADRRIAPKTQSRITEMLEIINRIRD